MKTNKIGVLFLVTALALAGVGTSYAMWSEIITIDGSVTAGSLDIEWSLEGYDDDEIDGKDDTSSIAAYLTDDGVLHVELYGVYPCINYWVDFDVHSVGTVPVHFALTCTPPELFDSEIIKIIPDDGYALLYGYDAAGNYIGTQLHQDEHWYGRLNFHITNELWTDVLVPLGWYQGGTFSFEIELMGHQYNECPEDQPFSDPVVTPGEPDWNSKAAGVRYKGFNSGGEIYLGPMTSGSATPRVETNYNDFGTAGQKTYQLTFSYDNVENEITTSITSPDANLAFDFDTDGSPGSDPSTWDAMEIVVRDSRSDSGAALENVMLDAYALGDFATVDKAGTPGWQQWTVTGFDFTQSFTVTADLVVDGYNGNEAI